MLMSAKRPEKGGGLPVVQHWAEYYRFHLKGQTAVTLLHKVLCLSVVLGNWGQKGGSLMSLANHYNAA